MYNVNVDRNKIQILTKIIIYLNNLTKYSHCVKYSKNVKLKMFLEKLSQSNKA